MGQVRYFLKTDGMEFECTKKAVLKMDRRNGVEVQKIDRATQLPVFTVELTVFTDEDQGSSVLSVSLPSATYPDLRFREPVLVEGLEMIPWANTDDRNGLRSGVAWRAERIVPVENVSTGLAAA
jgi:hypothetical protein